jgi:cytochrome c-type biogenesis protein CcmE
MKKTVYSIAGVAVLVVAGFLIYRAMNTGLVYFITPSEYAQAPDKYINRRIQLGGIVEPNSVSFDDQNLMLAFNITDTYQTYAVSHRGAPPELFKPGTGVVIEGKFEGQTFVSDEVKVKHSEVYEPPKAGEQVDIEELKDSLY